MSLPGRNRDEQKRDWEDYREAARRLHPEAKITTTCNIFEDAELSGAYVEVLVWVPRAALNANVSSHDQSSPT